MFEAQGGKERGAINSKLNSPNSENPQITLFSPLNRIVYFPQGSANSMTPQKTVKLNTAVADYF